jgi:hypothetical protein
MREEFERMIELGKCGYKLAVLKIVRPDTDPEYTYQLRLDGLRYGQFGIVQEDEIFYVVHVGSGRVCGEFTVIETAEREVFLLRKLTDWRKVGWSDNEKFLKSPFRFICAEAAEYCVGLDKPFDRLAKAVKAALPKTKEEIVEEFAFELQSTPFGDDEEFVPPKRSEAKKDDGWGHTIT